MINSILKIENLSASYDDKVIIQNINLEFQKNKITAIMGPSGCGKTTLLRCLNRMHELTPNAKVSGKILLESTNLNDNFMELNSTDPILVRRRIGMVFQRPNPFPNLTIYQNVLAGYLLNGIKLKKQEADEIVEKHLNLVALWDEVKDNLKKHGTFLSGGQQQRLCIARALAMEPDVLLLDEPTSALDPISTQRIEDLIVELQKTVTIIIVTHNVGQAGRVSDFVAFLYLGDLIEYGLTDTIFTNPKNLQTEKFLTGKIS